jgi:hypothetical protein
MQCIQLSFVLLIFFHKLDSLSQKLRLCWVVFQSLNQISRIKPRASWKSQKISKADHENLKNELIPTKQDVNLQTHT